MSNVGGANLFFSADESVSAVMDDLEASGSQLLRMTSDLFWSGWNELKNAPFVERYPALDQLIGHDVVLGFLGRSHIGDVLCVSSLIRLLSENYRCRVRVVRHRSTYKVLENHPHVAGFCNDDRIPLGECARGPGHIIQKFQNCFGLPLNPFPRPNVYLSGEESSWAWQIRSMLPRNRPVAIVGTNTVTDNRVSQTDLLSWQKWADIVARHFTVVQLALTDIGRLEEVVRLTDSHRTAWKPDRILNNCFVLENLSVRQYFAMFSVANFYLGPNASGAHLAAAFDVPAVVVLNSKQYGILPSFPDRIEGNRWRHESFLYPFHSFLLV